MADTDTAYHLTGGGVRVNSLPIQHTVDKWAFIIDGYDKKNDLLLEGTPLTLYYEMGDEFVDFQVVEVGDHLMMSAAGEKNAYFEVSSINPDKETINLVGKNRDEVVNELTSMNSKEEVSDVIEADDENSSQKTSAKEELTKDAEIGDINLKSALTNEAYDEDGLPISEQVEDTPVIGYQMFYTTGTSLRVPENALHNKLDSLAGIEEWMYPSAPRPRNAFCRALSNFFDEPSIESAFKNAGFDDVVPVKKQMENDDGRIVHFRIEQNGTRYDRTLLALEKVLADEITPDIEDRIVEEDETNYLKYEVGRFYYDKEARLVKSYLRKEAEGTEYESLWKNRVTPQMRAIFNRHKTHVMGNDINQMMSKFSRKWTDGVRVRDGMYFIPALYSGLNDILASFHELYNWLDEKFKQTGKTTEFYYNHVQNTEQQQNMVRSRITDEIDTEIDSLFETLEERISGEEMADEIVEEVLSNHLNDMDEYADQYNEILRQKLDVENLIDDRLNEVEDDLRDILHRKLRVENSQKMTMTTSMS